MHVCLGNDTVRVANSVINHDRHDIVPEYWFILFFLVTVSHNFAIKFRYNY